MSGDLFCLLSTLCSQEEECPDEVSQADKDSEELQLVTEIETQKGEKDDYLAKTSGPDDCLVLVRVPGCEIVSNPEKANRHPEECEEGPCQDSGDDLC